MRGDHAARAKPPESDATPRALAAAAAPQRAMLTVVIAPNAGGFTMLTASDPAFTLASPTLARPVAAPLWTDDAATAVAGHERERLWGGFDRLDMASAHNSVLLASKATPASSAAAGALCVAREASSMRVLLPRSAVRHCLLLTLLAAAAACSGDDGGTSPPKPAGVQAVSGSGTSGTVGAALPSAPTFTVTDASGNALGNVAVTVVVTGGGGTLVGAPTKTSAGPTAVGTWTLGTTAGTNSLMVTVAGVTPLIITTTGAPESPTRVVVSARNSQTALAGTQLSAPLAAAVQDQYGNGVANQQVTFVATVGGGTVSPGIVATNASGIASGAIWRLGNRGGPQTATARAGAYSTSFDATVQSNFTLDLRSFGAAISPEAQADVTNAANRIKAAIVGKISLVGLQGADLASCGVTGLTGTLNEATNGVIIYAGVGPIDGAGKVLAQAGPCYVPTQSILPAVGVMRFDEADIANYINSGRFESVVLHEMNHVVGFGTIWSDKNLLLNPAYTNTETPQPTGSLDPRYTGAVGPAQCLAIGVSSTYCAGGGRCGGGAVWDGRNRRRPLARPDGRRRLPRAEPADDGASARCDGTQRRGESAGSPPASTLHHRRRPNPSHNEGDQPMTRHSIAKAMASHDVTEKNPPPSHAVPSAAANFLRQWFVMRHDLKNANPADVR